MTGADAELMERQAVPAVGNGLAVVLDGDGLDTARMQDFARWTNFSETTFIQMHMRVG